MWSQSGLPTVPGWNAGNGDNGQTGTQDWASYYQAMPSNQVDWGSLAQQWIAMKTENTLPPQTFDEVEPPPPAPGEEQFNNAGRSIKIVFKDRYFVLNFCHT